MGPFQVHPHLVFEALAYGVGFQIFRRMRRQDFLARDRRLLVIVAAVTGALIGAKVLAWLVEPSTLWADRSDPRAWIEGKTIVGGLLGGLIATEWTKKLLGITRSTGDLYAIPLAVGIAIGRIGCFLAGLPDRTYGDHTGLPWGIDFGDGARHPTQLYEIAFLVALVWLLVRQRRVGFQDGDQFRLFMVAYLGWRFLVGFIQPGETILFLAGIQWACLAGLFYYARHLPRLMSTRGEAPV